MQKQVTIVGVGPGSRLHMTTAVQRAVEQAGLLLGAPRLLELFPELPCKKQAAVLAAELAQLVEQAEEEAICILMSGDTGFYSGAKRLVPLLSKYQPNILPGIGSLPYLCARIAVSWEDVTPISAHGRQVNVPAVVAAHEKTFFLTDGVTTAGAISRILTENGLGDCRVTVGSRLSYPDEQIVTDTAQKLQAREFDALCVVLVERAQNPLWDYATGGIPDHLFVRGSVPMTKQEVRAVSVAKLRVRESDIVYDVGAGTGSVSVELALMARRGCVYAIEKNPEAWELILQNRRKFGAFSIALVQGTAPAALAELSPPNAAFLGGSGGELEEILRVLYQKNPQVRVVINAVTVETVERALRLLNGMGFQDVQAVQLAVTRTETAGKSHLLRAQNPVFVISGQGAGV